MVPRSNAENFGKVSEVAGLLVSLGESGLTEADLEKKQSIARHPAVVSWRNQFEICLFLSLNDNLTLIFKSLQTT
jgi:hypothetical protein